MKVGEMTTRLAVPYRQVRYVLEQGILPKGVNADPGRGDHRELDHAQAFWLAIVLKLKMSGLKTSMAKQVADFAEEGVRGIAANLNWDYRFNPFIGRFESENQWYVDIGDLEYVRMATDANPSHQGLYEFPWSKLGKCKTVGVKPIVIIRLDLSELASWLRC
jgi:hypothetical protein